MRPAKGPIKKEMLHKINDAITSPVVRIVGDNVEQGILPLKEALEKAYEQELDLVEISPSANPPVCRIVDYQKFMYELKKKQKEQKKSLNYQKFSTKNF